MLLNVKNDIKVCIEKITSNIATTKKKKMESRGKRNKLYRKGKLKKRKERKQVEGLFKDVQLGRARYPWHV